MRYDQKFAISLKFFGGFFNDIVPGELGKLIPKF